MAEQKSVTVRVPASTANLGPGFDCLGLALDIWNEVNVKTNGQGISIHIEGEGKDHLPRSGSNLILRAMSHFYKESSIPFPKGIEMRCKNAIPTCSGLGSSSSAIIAGLLAAKHLLDSPISNDDLLAMAAEFEGHADNVAACLLGGLVIVSPAENRWITEKVAMQPLKAVIVLPEIKISTKKARAALPDMISRQAAVENLGRTALLVHALREGRKDLLSFAMRDSLHQPQRLKLIPGAENALHAAYRAGAYGAALSGAGPSLIAFGEKNLEEIGTAMQTAFSAEKINSQIIQTCSTQQSAN